MKNIYFSNRTFLTLMTQMRFWVLALMVFQMCFLTSCDDDDDSLMNEATWIADPENYSLPKYSEWGYNTFGCVVNGLVFRSNMDLHSDMERPLTITEHEDQRLTFRFQTSEWDYYDTRFINEMTIDFPWDRIDGHPDLVSLDGVVIDLADEDVVVTIGTRTLSERDAVTCDTVEVDRGELEIRRVQLMYVDYEFYMTVVSGTFGLSGRTKYKSCDITQGRFDVGISGILFGE